VRLSILCQWANAIATPPIPPPPLVYELDTATITWTDKNSAGQSGNLSFFNSTADRASVSKISLNGTITLINLISLPALQDFNASTLVASIFDISNNPLLIRLSATSNFIPVSQINAMYIQLVEFGLFGGTIHNFGVDSGPPDGLAAKATLISRGWTVT
jgi:hypothetical protein